MATRKNSESSPLAEDDLSAYLDGELDPAARQALEARLARDPALRAELQRLERAWGMLDGLPTATVEKSFSRSTMAMVAVAASQELTERQSLLPRQRRMWKLAALVGLLAAVLGGVLVGRWAWPNPNRQLLHDLPLLEELDLYRHADGIEFLRELDSRQLFPDDTDHAESVHVSTIHNTSRRERLESMTDDDRQRLLHNQERFTALSPEAQEAPAPWPTRSKKVPIAIISTR